MIKKTGHGILMIPPHFFTGYKGCDPNFIFPEITFEQFKKYVLGMKEEQEIVRWKLKDNCKKYLPALDKISPYFSLGKEFNFVVDSEYFKDFKEAGVLDLWFEPVYKEKEKFKVGDWVKLSETANGWGAGSEICNAVVKLTEIKKELYNEKVYFIHEGFKKRTNYNEISRLATPEEIKAAQFPQITINGYKAEFFDEYVKFGCQEISIDFLKKLYHLQNSHNVDITANKEAIKKLAEYYRNKK